MDTAGRTKADHVGEANPGALDLTVSGLASQVGGDLVDVGHTGRPNRMPFGDQSTRHVDRGPPVAERTARVDELTGSAPLAKAQVVVVNELGGREAVVQLHQVEVFGTHPGRLIGLGSSVPGQGVHVGLHLAALHPRVGGKDRG